MLFVKSTDKYNAYVQCYENSGVIFVEQIDVFAKNNETLDCNKIAKKLLKDYQDQSKLAGDLQEFGQTMNFIQKRS